jgi:plasmid stabilization system protein ParE
MSLRVLPEADAELIAASSWYASRQPGLADEFLSAIQAAYERIAKDPLARPRLETYAGHREVRRESVTRFPYSIVFVLHHSDIIVVAIAHTHRAPLYWLRRLS